MKNNTVNRRQFVTAVSSGSIAAIISNPLYSFGNETEQNDLAALITIQNEKWVEINNVIYGAKPDNRGPIGGGSGYTKILTKGDITVTDLESLIEGLKKAKAGQVVFIPGNTLIDMTTHIYIDELVLTVPAGVTLASDRGSKGSQGAIITSDTLKTPVMIKTGGPNVRITGLRIQGPNPKRYLEHHKKSFGSGPSYTDGLGSDYYYKFPTSNGVIAEHSDLEVDNCEISAFSLSGVGLNKGDGHNIHHNFIHKCQYNGLGYGVCLSGAFSLIEYNLFNENRHSIAGTGRPGEGYLARHNVEIGISLSHCFDMHGGRDRKDGTNIAGKSIEVYNNTFGPPNRAVVIRGVPEEKCEVHHNWFQKHSDAKQAVGAEEKTKVFNNAYGTKPIVD